MSFISRKKNWKFFDMTNELGVGNSTFSNIWKTRYKVKEEFRNKKNDQ